MSAQENKQLVTQGYQRFQSNDIPGLLNLFADDIEWKAIEVENAPFLAEYHGKEQVGQFFATLGETQDALQFEPREFIADGDNVVVLGHAVWSVKSTDRRYETDWAHVFTVRNGKVVRFQEYDDTAAIAAAFKPRD